jgi:hypothetical protein
MFRCRAIGVLRRFVVSAENGSRNDTEYLRSSLTNEARLNAAIDELDAARRWLVLNPQRKC